MTMTDHSAGLAEALQQALEKISRGASLNEALQESSAPDQVRPLLIAALRLRKLSESIEVPAPADSLNAFLRQGAAIRQSLTETSAKKRWISILPWSMPQMSHLMAAAGLILILLLGGGLTGAAQTSLPGDTLFPLKQFSEEVFLALPGNAASRQNLRSVYQQRRLDELKSILQAGRAEALEFDGLVENLQGNRLVIAGFNGILAADGQVTGRLGVGALVHAAGRTTSDGELLLSRIQVLKEGPQPAPAPSPLPQPQKTPLPPTITPNPTGDDFKPEATVSSKEKDMITPAEKSSPLPPPETTIEPPSPTPTQPAEEPQAAENNQENSGSSGVEAEHSNSSAESSAGSSSESEKESSDDNHSAESAHSGED
jgi:hypothetical protein